MKAHIKAPRYPCDKACQDFRRGDCPAELWSCRDYRYYRQQTESGAEKFKAGDTVWHEPQDPVRAKDPVLGHRAGWLGHVRYDTGDALFLCLDESREEVGVLVPIRELRRRILPP